VPNDRDGVGTLNFEFKMDVTIQSIEFISIESGEGGGQVTLQAKDANGADIGAPLIVPGLGFNSYLHVEYKVSNVRTLCVTFSGRGGVSNITYFKSVSL
jgi:hypothetical protein